MLWQKMAKAAGGQGQMQSVSREEMRQIMSIAAGSKLFYSGHKRDVKALKLRFSQSKIT